jgi:hypothetical protein
MTTQRPGSPRRGGKELNLALLMPALPPVILPSGTTHQIMPLTARGYEMFKTLREMQRQYEQTNVLDEAVYLQVIDDLLALVLPTATPDDLASLGFRVEVKLAPILAAAGRVDDVLLALEESESAPNGEALSVPLQSTESAAPSPTTHAPLDKTG